MFSFVTRSDIPEMRLYLFSDGKTLWIRPNEIRHGDSGSLLAHASLDPEQRSLTRRSFFRRDTARALAKSAEADLRDTGYDAKVQVQQLVRPFHIALFAVVAVGIVWILFL
jgi:hypothetical protein